MERCTERRRQLAAEFLRYQKVFAALGDETRQRIFVTLLQNETVGMRVPEITEQTHLSRHAVSHHLRILRDAGLIGMHRAGTRNYYYVDANESCWGGLRRLVELVDETAVQANASGYPGLKEEEEQ